eukprot:10702040-Karenia_brevis.AAC.1
MIPYVPRPVDRTHSCGGNKYIMLLALSLTITLTLALSLSLSPSDSHSSVPPVPISALSDISAIGAINANS